MNSKELRQHTQNWTEWRKSTQDSTLSQETTYNYYLLVKTWLVFSSGGVWLCILTTVRVDDQHKMNSMVFMCLFCWLLYFGRYFVLFCLIGIFCLFFIFVLWIVLLLFLAFCYYFMFCFLALFWKLEKEYEVGGIVGEVEEWENMIQICCVKYLKQTNKIYDFYFLCMSVCVYRGVGMPTEVRRG